MSWYQAVAYFIGGAFLANFSPHLIAGVTGRTFPTPFASPPFRGPSSPAVNVLWALFNLALAYLLLLVVGDFDPRRTPAACVAAAGFGLAALGIARSASRLKQDARTP